jgi:hypothetical protein
MTQIIDFQQAKARLYNKRREKIQKLTGMVGQPIDLEALCRSEDMMDSVKEFIYEANELNY